MKLLSYFVIFAALLAAGTLAIRSDEKGKAKAGIPSEKEFFKEEATPQKTCPIMGGAINKKLYVDHEGKRIYVCCAGCIGQVKKAPAKIIEKIEKSGEGVEKAPPKTIKKGDLIKHGVSYIKLATLKKWMKSDNPPLIIDVLSPESYKEAHVEGAVNIPLEVLKEKAAGLDKNRTTVVYCANYRCGASTQAAELLTKLGFKDVHDYKGGIKEWKESHPAKEAGK